MAIKSSQTLVKEALEIVKTISPEEALNLSKKNQRNVLAKWTTVQEIQ